MQQLGAKLLRKHLVLAMTDADATAPVAKPLHLEQQKLQRPSCTPAFSEHLKRTFGTGLSHSADSKNAGHRCRQLADPPVLGQVVHGFQSEKQMRLALIRLQDIAYDIKRTKERIADFSERWYSEKDKREAYENMEYLEEADRQCFLTAKRILENGQIDTEDKNNIGKTALDIAWETGARRIGALLSGQDPDTDELSALIGGLDVFQALWYKDMIALDAILRSGTELQTVCEDKKLYDFKGRSPLACALLWDNAEAAEMLLRSGADPDFKDLEEQTAFAVWLKKRKHGSEKKEDCLHLLQYLMQCGWNPEKSADKEGNTALSLACREAGCELGIWAARYLIENGADVNTVNLQGQTPAMNLYGGCFWDGNIPRIAMLPRSYPYGGRYCTEEDADMLETLLEAGADVNAKDKWGNTLLHYIAGSSQRGAKEAVGLVMDFGRPDVNAVNNEGKTVLDIATEKNDEALIKFLLKYY